MFMIFNSWSMASNGSRLTGAAACVPDSDNERGIAAFPYLHLDL